MKECDQMARLFVQYLTFHNKENLHKIRIFTKVGSIFCQAPTKKTSKDAQVVNFPQIWSQCHHYALLCSVLSFNNCFYLFRNVYKCTLECHFKAFNASFKVCSNYAKFYF